MNVTDGSITRRSVALMEETSESGVEALAHGPDGSYISMGTGFNRGKAAKV